MNNEVKWRSIVAAIIVLSGLVVLLPNFIKVGEYWPSQKALKYGLDIQGGLHLVMGVDIEGMIDETLVRTVGSLDSGMKEKSVAFKSVSRHPTEKGWMRIELNQASEVDGVTAYLDKEWISLQVMDKADTTLNVKFVDSHLEQLKERTMGQAIETIRNRIDEFGVSEPSITAQGKDRILIQLPGLEDATRAKELINRTAKLTFMLVSTKAAPDQLNQWVADAEKAGGYTVSSMKYSEYIKKLNADLKGKLPDKTQVLFAKNENVENMALGKVAYLLESEGTLGGESLKDAFVTTGQYNEPEVSLGFTPMGSKQFADITGNNVGRQLAIVLDDVVYSAPNIQTKIANGNARITLGGGRDYNRMLGEAKLISMALRAGALPARLEQLEERTIGPTLGGDSVRKGVQAAVVAGILVIAFMLFYYRFFGLIADVALMVNVLLTLAILTLLDATLTLPGIAGIALTLGIAVDANVIIFERIKEELEKGASSHVAVREGFNRAFAAIFDANLVTAFTAGILSYYGNGPVRGFGVTLLIGIATSMFTAIFLTRTIIETIVLRHKDAKLSI